MIYFKKYISNEDNGTAILKAMQRSCTKHYMIKYSSVTNLDTKDKSYRNFPCHIERFAEAKKTSNGEEYKMHHRFSGIFSSFVNCSESHLFKNYKARTPKAWEENPFSSYSFRPMVHLDLYGGGAMLVEVGDRVRFLPFGIFAIYAIDAICNKNEERFTLFIPNPFHRIKCLDDEIAKRSKDWADCAEEWDACEERDDDLDDDEYILDDEFDMRDLID